MTNCLLFFFLLGLSKVLTVPQVTQNVGPAKEESCPCTYATIWLDIMVIIEATPATTERGTSDMLAYVNSNLAWLSIKKTDSSVKMSSRVGLISYGTNATLISPLGEHDNTGFDALTLPFYSTTSITVALDDALRLAISELSSSRHRLNARPVIVLMASTYNPYNNPIPNNLAKTFREQKGIIIVYDYIQTHGMPSEFLPNLASPGYFLNNLNSTHAFELNDKLCMANCFCPVDFISFSNNQTFGIPSEYCYLALPKPSNYSHAAKTCEDLNGCVAMANEHKKSVFLRKQWKSTKQIWTGLVGTTSKGFIFADETPMNYYRPWRSGDFDSELECVAMGTDLFWGPANCQEEHHFACQANPCSSTKYCELDPSQMIQ